MKGALLEPPTLFELPTPASQVAGIDDSAAGPKCDRCGDTGAYYDGLINGGQYAIRCACGAPLKRPGLRFGPDSEGCVDPTRLAVNAAHGCEPSCDCARCATVCRALADGSRVSVLPDGPPEDFAGVWDRARLYAVLTNPRTRCNVIDGLADDLVRVRAVPRKRDALPVATAILDAVDVDARQAGRTRIDPRVLGRAVDAPEELDEFPDDEGDVLSESA
jgi:hypothetical protein